MGIVIFGASSYLAGGLILAAVIILVLGYAAMFATMCAVGPFLALHNWLIGKDWYQRFAGKIPGYLGWIQRRRQEQRDEHAQWKRERDEYIEHNRYSRCLDYLIEEYDKKHREPYDPDAHGDNGTAADVSRDEG